MSNFILTLENSKKTIKDLKLGEAFAINSRSKNEKILIYDDDLKQKYASKRFIKIYASYLKALEDFFDDDPDDTGFSNLISEGDRLEDILKHEFIKYLKAKDYELFLKDLLLVRETLEEEYQKFKRKDKRR